MQAVRHIDVGYKLIAIKAGLLSHTSRIYIDSLQQKQAILRLFEPYCDVRYPLFGWYRNAETLTILPCIY